MAQTKYQRNPPSALTSPAYSPSPARTIQITGQGTVAHPVPPKPVSGLRAKLPTPSKVGAPGAQGTI